MRPFRQKCNRPINGRRYRLSKITCGRITFAVTWVYQNKNLSENFVPVDFIRVEKNHTCRFYFCGGCQSLNGARLCQILVPRACLTHGQESMTRVAGYENGLRHICHNCRSKFSLWTRTKCQECECHVYVHTLGLNKCMCFLFNTEYRSAFWERILAVIPVSQ
jgi:hypothetical protein